MHVSRRSPSVIASAAAARVLLALVVAGSGLLTLAPSVSAAEVTLEARALLGGHVRPGAWTAVSVTVTNQGPAVNGELRVRTTQQGRSQHGVAVELANEARQVHTLYAQPAIFGSRLVVELVNGEQVLATTEVQIRSHDAYAPIVAIVAERPEGIQRDVGQAVRNPNFGTNPTIITLRPDDLPARVEAWSAIDRLVWQDVDASLLSERQLEAMRLWVGAGGGLVVLGGTTGVGSLAGFPTDLLPYTAERTVDVSTSELVALIGRLPTGATSLPAVAGNLRAGTVLARSGDHTIAARSTYGQGAVTMVGINPATEWLAGSASAESLWRRLLPIGAGPYVNPINIPDEYIFQSALYNLPAVALPPIEQLFVLLIAYIALIGPVNYLVLRRLDRREWAWLTMPLLVAVFAVGSYGLGAALKGSDVIVNQVAIVRAGQGTERGIGQVYVGVFSPTRRSFDVRINAGALLSSPTSQSGIGQTEQPIDALIGENVSRLRNFEVGFGVIRGFRADAQTDAPRVTADLHLSEGRLVGSVRNESTDVLQNVAVVFGGGVAVLPELAAGQSAEIQINPAAGFFGYGLSERIFGTSFPRDPVEQRVVATRRAVIDQLSSYGSGIVGASSDVPMLLAWTARPALEIELAGERPNRVGDSLYMVPLGVTYDAKATFTDALLVKTVVDSSSDQAWNDGGGYYLGRGTMTVEVRPAGLNQPFRAESLELALTAGGVSNLNGNGKRISPLPDAQQPAQDDPLGDPAAGDCFEPPCDDIGGGGRGEPGKPFPEWQALPAVQLFDHAAGQWYEFEQFSDPRSYVIDEPGRWIDDTGRLLLRLVNRSALGESSWFQLLVRMQGTIE